MTDDGCWTLDEGYDIAVDSCILRLSSYILHPTSYILHPTYCILHPPSVIPVFLSYHKDEMMFEAVLDFGWNILLALIPVGLAYLIPVVAGRWVAGSRRRFVLLLSLGLLWMLFLPNSCYLLTEWRHFLASVEAINPYSEWRNNRDTMAGIWLMTMAIFYFVYSAFGMLTFTLAIRPVARLLRQRGYSLQLLGIPFFVLISLGVYLGLVHRFNSWNVFSVESAFDILSVVARIFTRPALAAFLALFAGFLWLAYLAVDIWIDGFLLRWRGRASE